jgi:hypothetical protein
VDIHCRTEIGHFDVFLFGNTRGDSLYARVAAQQQDRSEPGSQNRIVKSVSLRLLLSYSAHGTFSTALDH